MNNKSNNTRIVITGLGAISSIGIGAEEFWKNLLKGKSGISKVTAFDTSEYQNHHAGVVKNFNPGQFIHHAKLRKIPRASKMAIAATKLALKDAGITISNIKNTNIGISIGTTMGESQVIEQIMKHSAIKEKWEVLPARALIYPANTITTNIADAFKLKGENIVFANACAAGNFAVGRAFDLIRLGKYDSMIAGGVDALSRIAFTGFNRLLAMSSDKCRPFDKDRKGMILGEGAGVMVLESLESAKKRKATIYAEVLGYGVSCDAKHMTNPSSSGIAKAIDRCLKGGNIAPRQVDYICAHGTGTPENDKAECHAIHEVFGARTKDIPVSSIKSMLGHPMGAASALELINCCLAIKHNKIPPTINFETKDPLCDIDCVPNVAREKEVKIALNNASAFGGNNACVGLGEVLINKAFK